MIFCSSYSLEGFKKKDASHLIHVKIESPYFFLPDRNLHLQKSSKSNFMYIATIFLPIFKNLTCSVVFLFLPNLFLTYFHSFLLSFSICNISCFSKFIFVVLIIFERLFAKFSYLFSSALLEQ